MKFVAISTLELLKLQSYKTSLYDHILIQNSVTLILDGNKYKTLNAGKV